MSEHLVDPSRADDLALRDMLRYAQKVVYDVGGTPRDMFMDVESLQVQAFWYIAIIGEAARRVSPEGKARLPQVQWRGIIAMRNVLVHEYWRIQKPVVWKALQDDVPALISLLEPVIGSGARPDLWRDG